MVNFKKKKIEINLILFSNISQNDSIETKNFCID